MRLAQQLAALSLMCAALGGMVWPGAFGSTQALAGSQVTDDEPPPTYIPAPNPTWTPESTGTGLRGEYFDTTELRTPLFSRVDAKIHFAWGRSSPNPRINPDTFSIRWQGFVKPRYDGEYTFSVYVDNGVRLWIGNTLIIDKWQVGSPHEVSSTIKLQANRKVPIRLEFFESKGGASVKLYWQSSAQHKEIIPQSCLYPVP